MRGSKPGQVEVVGGAAVSHEPEICWKLGHPRGWRSKPSGMTSEVILSVIGGHGGVE